MKRLYAFLRSALPSCMALLGIFPVSLALCQSAGWASPVFLWIQLLIAAGSSLFFDRFTGGQRLLPAFAGGLVLFGTAILTIGKAFPLLLSVPALFTAALLYLARPRPLHASFPFTFFLFCTALYLAEQVYLFTAVFDIAFLSLYLPSLPIGFLLFFFCALLLNNQELLEDEVRFGRAVPSSILRLNRFHILLLTALSILVTCLPQVSSFLLFLWDGWKSLIHSLFSLLSRLWSGGSDVIEEPALFPQDSLLIPEDVPAETPENPILQRLVSFLSGLLLALLVAFVLFKTIQGLLRLFRFLTRRLQSYLDELNQTYTDTYEDLSPADTVSGTVPHIRPSRKEPGAGTPRERIRLLYRKLLRRHPEWLPSETVQNHLPFSAAVLYGKARYSDHEITQEDVLAFEESMKTPSMAK